jgi:hypothetical protein
VPQKTSFKVSKEQFQGFKFLFSRPQGLSSQVQLCSQLPRAAVSPLAGPHQLFYPAFDKVTLKGAEVIDVKPAIEMVGLVQKRAGQ